MAVIHNGTINNSYDLKKELQAKGIVFLSETDTEVIAHLIGKHAVCMRMTMHCIYSLYKHSYLITKYKYLG